MSALRLLCELKKRHRIQSAASAATERQPERDPQTLVEKMRQIYGLNRKFQATVYEHQYSSDERLLEQLRAFCEKRADVDPTSAALATRLASRILQVPLDEQTEAQVARLEVTEEDDVQEMVGEDNADEGTDTGPSDGGNERHVDNPDVDNND